MYFNILVKHSHQYLVDLQFRSDTVVFEALCCFYVVSNGFKYRLGFLVVTLAMSKRKKKRNRRWSKKWHKPRSRFTYENLHFAERSERYRTG